MCSMHGLPTKESRRSLNDFGATAVKTVGTIGVKELITVCHVAIGSDWPLGGLLCCCYAALVQICWACRGQGRKARVPRRCAVHGLSEQVWAQHGSLAGVVRSVSDK